MEMKLIEVNVMTILDPLRMGAGEDVYETRTAAAARMAEVSWPLPVYITRAPIAGPVALTQSSAVVNATTQRSAVVNANGSLGGATE
jgi:hypothetical protein